MDRNSIEQIIARIEKLEAVVFSSPEQRTTKLKSASAYAGPAGGIRMLIDEGYFRQMRTAKEVHSLLESRGYHYQKHVVQNALNRLASKNGVLVGQDKKDGKIYVDRK